MAHVRDLLPPTAPLSACRYVGAFGNADPLQTAEWVEVEKSVPAALSTVWQASSRSCSGIAVGLNVEFLTGEVGEVGNPQSKIIAARAQYATDTWTFKSRSSTQKFTIQSTVSFVPKAATGECALGPGGCLLWACDGDRVANVCVACVWLRVAACGRWMDGTQTRRSMCRRHPQCCQSYPTTCSTPSRCRQQAVLATAWAQLWPALTSSWRWRWRVCLLLLALRCRQIERKYDAHNIITTASVVTSSSPPTSTTMDVATQHNTALRPTATATE